MMVDAHGLSLHQAPFFGASHDDALDAVTPSFSHREGGYNLDVGHAGWGDFGASFAIETHDVQHPADRLGIAQGNLLESSLSSMLSPDNLDIHEPNEATSKGYHTDYVDYRGPVRSSVFNVSTKEVGGWFSRGGDVMETLGAGLKHAPMPWAKPVGGAMEFVGHGVAGFGGLLSKYPLTGSYLTIETTPNAQGIAELRSTYVGLGIGDLTTGYVIGDGATFNAGGPDLDDDGHWDGAYGLVFRTLTPVGIAGAGPFGFGAVNTNYYAPFDEGLSATVYQTGSVTGKGLGGPYPPSVNPGLKPTTFQVGLRWPSDASNFDHLVSHYGDMMETNVLEPLKNFNASYVDNYSKAPLPHGLR